MTQRAQVQKAIASRMLDDAVRSIRSAFADAEHSVAATVNEFVAAYRKQWDAVSASLANEETGDVDVAQRAAHLRHWLIVSGWRNRLLSAYRQAAHTASQASLAAIHAAQPSMVETGWNHGRQLVMAAMQPAVEAGAPWRPKP